MATLTRRLLGALLSVFTAVGLLTLTGSPASAVTPSAVTAWQQAILVAEGQPSVAYLYAGGLNSAVWGGFDGTNGYIASGFNSGAPGWSSPDVIYSGLPFTLPQFVTSGASTWGIWNPYTDPTLLASTSNDSGANWTVPTGVVSSPNPFYGYDLAVAGDGRTGHAVYGETGSGATPPSVHWVVSRDQGKTWSSPETLSADGVYATGPQIATSADGQDLICVWIEQLDDQTLVTYRRSNDAGVSWGPAGHLTATLAYDRDLQVSMSQDGRTVHVVWKSYGAGVIERIMANSSTDGGATWSGNQAVGTAQYVGPPKLQSSSDGVAAAVTWEAEDGVGRQIYTSNTDNSGTSWSAPRSMIPAGESGADPQISGSQDGSTLAAVWQTFTGQGRPSRTKAALTIEVKVAVSTNGGTDWEPAATLSEAGQFSVLPRVAVADGGESVNVMWVAKQPDQGADRNGVTGDEIRSVIGTIVTPPGPTPGPAPDKKVQKPANAKGKPPARIARDGVTVITGRNARTNARQSIRTRVRCVPVKAAAAGQTRYCSVIRGPKGKVSLRTYGAVVRVIVVQSAAPTAEYKRFLKRTVYVDGRKK